MCEKVVLEKFWVRLATQCLVPISQILSGRAHKGLHRLEALIVKVVINGLCLSMRSSQRPMCARNGTLSLPKFCPEPGSCFCAKRRGLNGHAFKTPT